MKKKNFRKILIVSAILVGFGVLAGGVSADNKVGCVDMFTADKQSAKAVTLNWDKGVNTDGYAVYRKESVSTAEYKQIADITDATTVKFVDKTVSPATKYDYMIKTYQKNGDEKIYSKGESLKTASSPVKTEKFELVAQNAKSISLKWQKVKGVTGYTIYRSEGKGKEFTKIADVVGKEKYVDRELTPAHSYHYYICSYVEVAGEKSYAEKSAVLKTATSPEQIKKIENDVQKDNEIKFKWDKSNGASGYVIYRMTENPDDYDTEVTYDEDGNEQVTAQVGDYVKYAVIGDGNKTYYEDKNLNWCQAYHYRVVPYFKADGQYYYGDYRQISTGTVTDKPKPEVFSRSKRVMAKWLPIKGAEGYEIFIAESKSGDYKSYGTTKDTIFLTKQLKADKIYYVRVKAYYMAGKQKIYSGCETKEVKCLKSNMVDKYNVDDTYIEIDLDMQHMWYFEDGKLVVSTPVVTGLKGYRDTSTGLFEIYNKESPANLVGESWNTYVTYWMAVTYDGQGIHDASWRWDSEYGGNTYTYDGSHGCINTPYDKVEEMYNKVKVGTPVVIYEHSTEKSS